MGARRLVAPHTTINKILNILYKQVRFRWVIGSIQSVVTLGKTKMSEYQNIPVKEYSLTGIFLFGYTMIMNTRWAALMEPNRLYIVELLRDGPLTVGQIAERLALRQPQVSKHLKVLSEAAIVEVQPQANRRIYQLRHEPFQELEAWIHSFHRLWDERFDRLDNYLGELQANKQQTSNQDEDNNV
jgi:DNA-binding transcriptional ArsR family regulator